MVSLIMTLIRHDLLLWWMVWGEGGPGREGGMETSYLENFVRIRNKIVGFKPYFHELNFFLKVHFKMYFLYYDKEA